MFRRYPAQSHQRCTTSDQGAGGPNSAAPCWSRSTESTVTALQKRLLVKRKLQSAGNARWNVRGVGCGWCSMLSHVRSFVLRSRWLLAVSASTSPDLYSQPGASTIPPDSGSSRSKRRLRVAGWLAPQHRLLVFSTPSNSNRTVFAPLSFFRFSRVVHCPFCL